MGNPITQPNPYIPLPTPGVQPVTETSPTETAAGVPVTPTPVATEAAPPVDQTDVQQRAAADFHPTNDKILFLGINPSATGESRTLRNQVGADNITIVQDSPEGILDGHDLNTEAGVASFVDGLALPEATSTGLKALLNDAEPRMRDEYANIAKVWAEGEKGGTVPSRLVLSGHSDGSALFSESGRGSFDFRTLGQLTRLMPQAAAQVEDIHISGCNSGFKVNSEIFKQNFPNLQTFWAYTGTAPSEGTGSRDHLRRWEGATQGRVDNLDRETVAAGLGKRSDSVAVWSAESGYQANPDTLSSDQSDQDMASSVDAYLRGDLELPRTSGSGPVFELYEQLQRRQGSLPADSPDRDYFQGLVDTTLKLRFHDKVVSNFEKTFGPELDTGYAEMGLERPDFSTMSRSQATAEIARFQEAFNSRYYTKASTEEPSPATERTGALLQGLSSLSPALMDSEWIEPFGPEQIERERAQSQDFSGKADIFSARWGQSFGNAPQQGILRQRGGAEQGQNMHNLQEPAAPLRQPTQEDYEAAIEELRTRMEALRTRRPAN